MGTYQWGVGRGLIRWGMGGSYQGGDEGNLSGGWMRRELIMGGEGVLLGERSGTYQGG